MKLFDGIERVEDMGMLAENMKKWAADYQAQGRVQGIEEGQVQGLEKGKRDLLLRLVESKYGLEAREQLSETLLRQTTTEALDRIGDLIIHCETAEELFERIRSSSNGIIG